MANTAAVPGKPRRDYIDALKGLGIILVVWGHFSEYYRGTSPVFNGLFECIYLFHMPLFCLCSGMVAKWKPGKLVFQQVWLYLVCQRVILWLRLHVWHEEVDLGTLTLEWLVPWRHMWYLYALIFWELTVPLLRLAREKGKWPGTAAALLAAVAVGLLGGLRTWNYSFGRVFASYPLFAAGYLLSSCFDAAGRAAKRWRWLRPAALAAFAAVYFYWLRQVLDAPEAVYEGDRIFNAGAYEGNFTMRTRFVLYLIGLLTALALLLAVGGSKWLAGLGRRTLPVYLVHMPVYAYLSYLQIFAQPNAFGPAAVGAWLVLATGGCVCFAASRPVCAVFDAVANVWYKGVPALVHWLQGRDLKED